MNTLQELNGYTNTLILPFVDNRLATVFFDKTTPTNRTQIVNEGSTFTALMGIEITDIATPESAVPVFRITVSNLEGATVSWNNLPNYITITNPSPGVYQVSGMLAEQDWQIVREPQITIPGNAPGQTVTNWTYGCSITYFDEALGNQIKSWTVAVSVLDVFILTNAFDFVYNLNATQTITNTPQISNLPEYADAVWTITATPSNLGSVTSFASTYSSGGTFTYNSSTKTFTIVGNRTEVNGHLNSISFTSTSIGIDFSLNYVLTNSIDQVIDNKTQFLKNANTLYLTNPEIFYYTEDAVNEKVLGTVQITDTSYTGTENYILTISPSDITLVESISTFGSTGTINFNPVSKVYTITGTKQQVNSRLDNLFITPASDVDSVFSLIYSVTTPSGDAATKIQNLICGSNDIEITNMNITRIYDTNTFTNIFSSNTPVITDFDTTGPDTYTIFLSSPLGSWELPQSVNPYIPGELVSTLAFSGTKSEVNTQFAKIRFYPDFNVSANGTFSYEQQKNGVRQVLQTVALNNSGTGGQFTPREVEFTVTQTWTPTPADIKYGKISKLLVVGAGGGGERGFLRLGSNRTFPGGAGGGGSVIIRDNNFAINFNSGDTYSINIGVGGNGGINSTFPASDGGNTTAFNFIANGGLKGTIVGPESSAVGVGGSSSVANVNGTAVGPFAGGTGGYWKGGGGGGSSSIGIGSPTPSTSEPASNEGYGGNGRTYDGKTNWFGAGGNGGYVSIRSGANGQTSGGLDTAGSTAGKPNSGAGGSGGGFNAGGAGGSGYVKIWLTSK
jgi:hypothetical protein